jgi:hypothetical protein
LEAEAEVRVWVGGCVRLGILIFFLVWRMNMGIGIGGCEVLKKMEASVSGREDSRVVVGCM